MYLKKDKRPNDRVYLSIVKSFRDPITKKSRQRAVLSVGFLDELLEQYPDPIAHFEELARQMTEQENASQQPLTFSFDKEELLKRDDRLRKKLGFLPLSFVYHKLELDRFLIHKQRNLNIEYSLNQVLQSLVYLRILEHSSKKKTYELLDSYFFERNFTAADIYRSLDRFSSYRYEILRHLNEMVTMKYGRNTKRAYYDVTNYYFEITKEDAFRKKGVSKEHRPNPLVQMGLLLDGDGIPLSYQLFEGSKIDSQTYMPFIHELKDEFNLKRVIVVADKGINTGENIAYNILGNNGYIFSQTIRGATNEIKDYVLDELGYSHHESGFKKKSRIVDTKIWVLDELGKRKSVEIEQKQVVFYRPDYDAKAKHERYKLIEKAKKNLSKKGHLRTTGSYKYIAKDRIDKKTGEVSKEKDHYSIDLDKVLEEEKYDGYYLIVTSELDTEDDEIIKAYRGLWKIEETFKLTKTSLKTRPVWLSRKTSIEAHFLTCFISLLLLRLLEKELKDGEGDFFFSPAGLIDSLKNYSSTYLDENYYLFDYYDDNLEKMAQMMDIDLAKRFRTTREIKDMIAKVKVQL